MSTQNYPLFISHQFLVACKGFFAGINMRGQILLEKEESDPEWWVYGISPAGFCASGHCQNEALTAFSERFRSVIHDLAETSESFAVFKAELEGIFSQGHQEYRKLWEEALRKVRENRMDLPEMTRSPGESKTFLEVNLITAPMPAQNEAKKYELASAKAA